MRKPGWASYQSVNGNESMSNATQTEPFETSQLLAMSMLMALGIAATMSATVATVGVAVVALGVQTVLLLEHRVEASLPGLYRKVAIALAIICATALVASIVFEPVAAQAVIWVLVAVGISRWALDVRAVRG